MFVRGRRYGTLAVVLFVLIFLSVGVGLLAQGGANKFSWDFSSAASLIGQCASDDFEVGPWKFIYHGLGCTTIKMLGGRILLEEKPQAAVRQDETHASLVLGPQFFGDVDLEFKFMTAKQLRKPTPNPWEVAWVIWHYQDDSHFYYLALKPNGWELGKEDPNYPGSQRSLADGNSPAFPIGAWQVARVAQKGNTIRIYANGELLARFVDEESPYLEGRIGLYNEDAEVYFDHISGRRIYR